MIRWRSVAEDGWYIYVCILTVLTVDANKILFDAQQATVDLLRDAGIIGNKPQIGRVENSYPIHLFDEIEH